MKRIITILLVLGAAAPALAAPTIIWVTEGIDTANNVTANTPGDGISDDQGWVDMLTAAGYNVNVQSQTLRWGQISLEEDAMLKSADLIIMSRNGASGTYTGNVPQLRTDLLAYCKMDTLAMVEVLGVLQQVVL